MSDPALDSRRLEDAFRMDEDAVAAARENAADLGRPPGVLAGVLWVVGAAGMALFGRLVTEFVNGVFAGEEEPAELTPPPLVPAPPSLPPLVPPPPLLLVLVFPFALLLKTRGERGSRGDARGVRIGEPLPPQEDSRRAP